MKLFLPFLFFAATAVMPLACTTEAASETIPRVIVATVKTNPDSAWYLHSDDTLKLWPINQALLVNPTHNARALVAYSILFNSRPPVGYDNAIDIKNFTDVPIATTQDATEHQIAQWEHTPLTSINNAWIGSQYLNIDFTFSYADKDNKHKFYILRESPSPSASTIVLYFKHDNGNDVGSKSTRNVLSIDLESLDRLTDEETVKIKFVTTYGENTEYSKELTYTFSDET